jgi:hypothetical protein
MKFLDKLLCFLLIYFEVVSYEPIRVQERHTYPKH